jgi:hypothetical protein
MREARSPVVVIACMLGCGRIGFDSTGGDGGTGDDAVDATMTATGACPATVALTDDFTSATALPIWSPYTNDPGLTISQGTGVLVLAFAAGNTPPGSSAGYMQTTAIDYSEACAIVELDALPSGGTDVSVGGPGEFVTFEFSGNEMICSQSSGGIVDRRTWDPVAHKFLRLRAHANVWYWEVSPDDVNYTTLGMHPNTSTVNPTTMSIEIVTPINVLNGGQARYRHVRVLVP